MIGADIVKGKDIKSRSQLVVSGQRPISPSPNGSGKNDEAVVDQRYLSPTKLLGSDDICGTELAWGSCRTYGVTGLLF